MQNQLSVSLRKKPKKPKILLYLLGSLGDTLVTIPALRAVRRHFRDAELIMLQNIPASGNVVRASQVIPENLIDGYLEYAGVPGKLGKVYDFSRLWRELRKHQFEAAVYLAPSERPARSIARDKMFFRSSGIRQFFGFHSFSIEELYPRDENDHPAMTENEAVRKTNRLAKDGIHSTDEDFRRPFLDVSVVETEKVERWLTERRRKKAARLISIAPGCQKQVNVWAEENFIEIGRRLLAEFDCEIIITGGKAEREIAAKMISALGEGISAAGEFSVRESGLLLSLCDFHVGLDTGTMHLAAVAGTPCFTLHSERTNPGQWFPIGGGHAIVFHPVKCAGCLAFVCPIPAHPCMTGISVEAVWQHLREFIRNEKTAPDAPTRLIAV